MQLALRRYLIGGMAPRWCVQRGTVTLASVEELPGDPTEAYTIAQICLEALQARLDATVAPSDLPGPGASVAGLLEAEARPWRVEGWIKESPGHPQLGWRRYSPRFTDEAAAQGYARLLLWRSWVNKARVVNELTGEVAWPKTSNYWKN